MAAPGTLWVLSSDGKYLVRPQADETSHKQQISCGRQGKRAFLLFPVSQRVSPLRRRPKGFPVALWKPSALCCAWGIPQETGFLRKAREEPSLLSTYHRGFRLCGGDQGLSGRSATSIGAAFRRLFRLRKACMLSRHWRLCLPFPLPPSGPHLQNLTQAAEPLPPGAFHRLSSFIPLWSVPIPPLLQDAS